MENRVKFIDRLSDEIHRDICKIHDYESFEKIILPNIVNLANAHMQCWDNVHIDIHDAFDILLDFRTDYFRKLFNEDDIRLDIKPKCRCVDFNEDINVTYSNCFITSFRDDIGVLDSIHTAVRVIDYISTDDADIVKNKLSVPIPLIRNVCNTGYLEIDGDVTTRKVQPMYDAFGRYPIVNLTFTWDEVTPKSGGVAIIKNKNLNVSINFNSDNSYEDAKLYDYTKEVKIEH